jgi:2-dehydropantoate 2-reductase
MAKIAIVGVGAIGGVVAVLLQQAGRHEVTLCTRRPLSDLSVETPDGTVQIDMANVVDSGDAPMVDWVMVATKAYDVAGAAKWLERLCANGAPVAVLQNGVEHRERFSPYVPMQSILPVMVDCPAERRSPGSVIQRGVMHLKVPESVEGSAFVDLFRDTAADVSVVADFKTVAWRKLCFNSAGVLSALLLQPAGVMHGEAIGEVARQIVLECIAVGRAEGAQLGDEVADDVLRSSRSQPVDSINSIYADRLAGRPVEIDARNGVIVRLGEKHGIPTPNNRMAVALLQAMTQQG